MIKFDFSDLIRATAEVEKEAERKVPEVTQKVTLDVYANAVCGSPVDTVAKVLPTVATMASLIGNIIRIGEWTYLKRQKRRIVPLDL